MTTPPKPANKAQLLEHLRAIHALLVDPRFQGGEFRHLEGAITYHVLDALEPGSGQAAYHRRMDAFRAAYDAMYKKAE